MCSEQVTSTQRKPALSDKPDERNGDMQTQSKTPRTFSQSDSIAKVLKPTQLITIILPTCSTELDPFPIVSSRR